MIEVEHLTKNYGPVSAINDVSFSVEKGETGDELSLTIGKRVPERGSFYALGGDEGIVMEIGGEFAAEWFDRF
jgi:hypothetical protein